jgi:hypothetical protein
VARDGLEHVTTYGPTLGGGTGQYRSTTLTGGGGEGSWISGTPAHSEVAPGGIICSRLSRSTSSDQAPSVTFPALRGLDSAHATATSSNDYTEDVGSERDQMVAIGDDSEVHYVGTFGQAAIVGYTDPDLFVPDSSEWPSDALGIDRVTPFEVTSMALRVQHTAGTPYDSIWNPPGLVAVEGADRPANPANGYPASLAGSSRTALPVDTTTDLLVSTDPAADSWRAFHLLNEWVLDGTDKVGMHARFYGVCKVIGDFSCTFPTYRFIYADPPPLSADLLAGDAIPPLRKLRNDGLALGTKRVAGGSRSVQGSIRRAGGYT